MRPGIVSAAVALERAQKAHEERLDWLRSLKSGDVVALTWASPEAKGERWAVVTRHPTNGALYVEGHPRRDVRRGKWERGGKAWLWLRIDPIAPPPG